MTRNLYSTCLVLDSPKFTHFLRNFPFLPYLTLTSLPNLFSLYYTSLFLLLSLALLLHLSCFDHLIPYLAYFYCSGSQIKSSFILRSLFLRFWKGIGVGYGEQPAIILAFQ